MKKIWCVSMGRLQLVGLVIIWGCYFSAPTAFGVKNRAVGQVSGAAGVSVADVLVISVGAAASFDQRLQRLDYTEQDAGRFARVMELVGQVPAANLKSYFDVGKQRLLDQLSQIQEHQIRPPGKVIFYFSGHADAQGLHFADGALAQSQLQERLQGFGSDLVLTIVDACFAGGVGGKGVRLVPGPTSLPKVDIDEPTGQIIMSASQPTQQAYEAASVKGGLFTHHLVAGLGGAADSDQDGLVTIGELYNYSYRKTKLASLSLPRSHIQKPWFRSKLQGSGAVVISYPARGKGQISLGDGLEGELRFYSENGLLSTSAMASRGRPVTVTLEHGRYVVVAEKAGQPAQSELVVEAGAALQLAAADFQWRQPLAAVGGKGLVGHGRSYGMAVFAGRSEPLTQRFEGGHIWGASLEFDDPQFPEDYGVKLTLLHNKQGGENSEFNQISALLGATWDSHRQRSRGVNFQLNFNTGAVVYEESDLVGSQDAYQLGLQFLSGMGLHYLGGAWSVGLEFNRQFLMLNEEDQGRVWLGFNSLVASVAWR